MPLKNNDLNTLMQIITMLKDTLLGLAGGLVAYLLQFKKEKEVDKDYSFSFVSLIINMILGGYVSYLVGAVLPLDFGYRDFVVGSVGVASYPILLFIESNFITIILQRLNITPPKKDKKGKK